MRPIVKVPCWDFTSLCESVMSALGQREVGRSSVHDQSSRTHAILELEIVTRQLMDLREAVKDRESELVPVGKRAADLMKISSLSCRRVDGNGIWVRDPNPEFDQEALDKAIEKRREFEDRVNTAELEVKRVMEDPARPECLGGRMVFVDLAGSEYQTETARSVSILQTPKEKQEGRQINMDLLALKEVIRARAQGLGRIPYRSSPLTMVLREYFEDEGAVSAIIVTISPAIEQVGATVNSLNYGRLLGAAGSR